MIGSVVGEKNYPLRIAPELYEQIRMLASQHERSVNWVMARLLRRALAETPGWIEGALGAEPRESVDPPASGAA